MDDRTCYCRNPQCPLHGRITPGPVEVSGLAPKRDALSVPSLWPVRVGAHGHGLCGHTHGSQHVSARGDGSGGRHEFRATGRPSAGLKTCLPLAAGLGATLSGRDELLLPQLTSLRVSIGRVVDVYLQKEAQVTPLEKLAAVYGDAWVWIAFSPYKLVPAWVVGKRRSHARRLVFR